MGQINILPADTSMVYVRVAWEWEYNAPPKEIKDWITRTFYTADFGNDFLAMCACVYT